MKLAAFLLIACAAMADAPKPLPIPELDALRLENVSLRLDLLTQQAEALHRERNELIRSVCAAAQIDIKECAIDPATRTVSRKESTK